MTIRFRGGRRHPDRAKPRLTLANYLTAAPPAPAHVDYLTTVADWPMYGNDRYGCCTCSDVGHGIEIITRNGQGTTVEVADADVIAAYVAITKPPFNPRTGANDNGALVQDALNYWRTNGIGGHKIAAFAEVDHRDLAECRIALSRFGTLHLGINFPASAMDQFNNGQPWDVVSGSHIEGGHAVPAGAYDTATGTWRLVTWGSAQAMTQAFWDRYVEESWVAISDEWVDAHGLSPEGVDLAALGEDFSALTGQPNPFPDAPTPAPVPPPVVDPSPVVDTDVALAAALHARLDAHPYYYKPVWEAAAAWLAAKNL